MIKPIITDKALLKQVSTPALINDQYIIKDLLDTFNNTKDCIGMAANMIGCFKTILVFKQASHNVVLINPKIISKKDSYIAYENCACFINEPAIKCIRYKYIKLEFLNENFEKRIKTFKDLDAEIIQHQLDHFNGIII